MTPPFRFLPRLEWGNLGVQEKLAYAARVADELGRLTTVVGVRRRLASRAFGLAGGQRFNALGSAEFEKLTPEDRISCLARCLDEVVNDLLGQGMQGAKAFRNVLGMDATGDGTV
jgi:hypothetical protein